MAPGARFDAVTARASELLGRLELMRMMCDSDTKELDEATRAAGFVGRQSVVYAYQRTLDALRITRPWLRVPFISANDFDEFVSHCRAGGLKFGVSQCLVGDALLQQSERALQHAELALAEVAKAYTLQGIDFATRFGAAQDGLVQRVAALDQVIAQEWPDLAVGSTAVRFRAGLEQLIEDCRLRPGGH